MCSGQGIFVSIGAMERHTEGLALAFASVGATEGPPANEAQLVAWIEEAVEHGRAIFPEFQVAPLEFASYLGRRISAERLHGQHSPGAEGSELYLCHACLTGDRHALEEFDRRLKRLRSLVARYTSEVDDVLQAVSEKLLVGVRGGPPRLEDFGGQGELDSWLRVVATRAAIDVARKRGHVLVDDEELWRMPSLDATSAATLQAAESGALIKAAFERALAKRTVVERLFLRQHLVDDLSIDEMAPMHGVHRVTIARRLTKLRNAIWSETKAHLSAQLTLPEARIESMLGDVRSRIDLSMERILA